MCRWGKDGLGTIKSEFQNDIYSVEKSFSTVLVPISLIFEGNEKTLISYVPVLKKNCKRCEILYASPYI